MMASADNAQPIEISPGLQGQMQTHPQQIQHLVETLVQRTGQPRTNVEQWVNGATKVLKGSFTFYDVSRMAGSFLAKRVQQAKPYMVRFGKSLLHDYMEQQRNLQAAPVEKSKHARSTNVSKRVTGTMDVSMASRLGAGKSGLKSRALVRQTAGRTGHNPWAPPAVLQTEPLLILSYQLDKTQKLSKISNDFTC